MKKNLLILIFLAFSAIALKAQTSGGPDYYGYTWRNSNDASGPVFNWIDISQLAGTVNVEGLADDNIVGPFPLNVPFHYYWYNPTNFYIGSNGYLEFDKNTPTASPFPLIPTAGAIEDYLAAMASDLVFVDPNNQPIAGAKCMYWQNSDTLIVTWDSVPFWQSPASGPGYVGVNSFQIILSNVDSSITYQYLVQDGSNIAVSSQFMTVGIESKAGSIGLSYIQNGLSNDYYPEDTTAIKFYFPPVDTAQIVDASTAWINNNETGAVMLSKGGAPFTSIAEAANSGNSALGSFDFVSRVVNRLNQVQVRDTVSLTPSTGGQTQTITFPDTWVPTDSGTYRQLVQTNLGASDMVTANNARTLEIRVLDTTQAEVFLSYDNGIDDGTGGLAWSGGGGGAAIYFVPPFAPYTITKLSAYIAANANALGFTLYVVDDDGANGGPFTVLDSVAVPGANVVTGGWNAVSLANPLTIPSGGFYLAWIMEGDGIGLGQNAVAAANPVSNRTFEILGDVHTPSAWSPWRSREIQDVMLNAWIAGVVGVNENAVNDAFGNIYPNPATDKFFLDYDLSATTVKSVTAEIYSLSGALISSTKLNETKGKIEMNVKSLAPGAYICSVKAGDTTIQRPFTVAGK